MSLQFAPRKRVYWTGEFVFRNVLEKAFKIQQSPCDKKIERCDAIKMKALLWTFQSILISNYAKEWAADSVSAAVQIHTI